MDIIDVCFQVYHEKSNGGHGWVENRGPPIFSSSGNSMVVIKPVQDSLAGYWPQIVQVDVRGEVPSSDFPISLTHGQFEVTKIIGWDEASHIV
jgi:hypothetical protein